MADFSWLSRARSSIVFIIVTIVLAIGVFTTIWFVQQRGEQVRRDEAAKIAQQNLEEQSKTPVIAETDETENKQAEASDGSKDNVPEAMPATGLESTWLVVPMALMAFAFVSYLQSRYERARR